MTGDSPWLEKPACPIPQAGSTVLIAEDDILVRMHGTEILEEAGYNVLEATDADEALVILTGERDIQLLFSGVDMPGSMDCLDLARLVQSRWPEIRLLLTSGHHRLEADRLPLSGAFVRKPWAQGALVERVRSMLTV